MERANENFDKEHLEALIASAEKTTGVPMTGGEQEKLGAIVEQIEAHVQRLAAVDSKLSEFVEKDEVLRQMTTVVGPACSAVIGALVGSIDAVEIVERINDAIDEIRSPLERLLPENVVLVLILGTLGRRQRVVWTLLTR
jgi:hypothetical protein